MQYDLVEIERQLLLLMRKFLVEQQSERAMLTLTLDMSFEKQLGIDSLAKVELFHRVEKAYGIQFQDQDMAQIDNLLFLARAVLQAKPAKNFKPSGFAPELKSLDLDLSNLTTLQEVLMAYALHNPSRPHIYFQDDNGQEQAITYGELLANAAKIANALISKGIKPDDTVALMLPSGSDFFYSFFGVLLAGAIPVPIYPPFRPDRIEDYALREVAILNNAEVRFLITFAKAERLSKILQGYISSLLGVATTEALLVYKATIPKIMRKANQAALIQYTSGSTGTPKGVLLSHYNIICNIKSANKAIELQPHDKVVSWLPLYHDMGLMSWIGSLYFGVPITIMSPLTFLNHPERWLWAIHYHRATLSAAPNFAYAMCLKRINEANLEGLDLSSWRIAFNGAEAISPIIINKFTANFKRYGFKPNCMFPVYGLAENTVALAFPKLGLAPLIDKIDRHIFEKQAQAIPVTNSGDYLEFVCVGKAIPDHEIRIVAENGNLLSERLVGNLQFKGPSAMQSYYRNPQATAEVLHDGWWDTGDLAYIAEGQLFITGRKKDLIIKAGRNLYPETIEDVVGDISGVRRGCVIAFGVADPKLGTEKIVIVAESKLTESVERQHLKKIITEQVTIKIGVPPDQVIIIDPHLIPKTSSGKLQRSTCKQEYLTGKLFQRPKKLQWQIFKLLALSISNRSKKQLNKALRAIYSIYLGIVILLTAIPMWILIMSLPVKIAAKVLRAWAKVIFFLTFNPVHIKNKQHLNSNRTAIYVANHASYSDTLLLISILPAGTSFIGKKELLRMPIVASAMKKLNHITVDRWELSKNLQDLKKIETHLNTGASILIFPEGTFSYASGLRQFKSGAFQLAVDTQTAIIPLALSGTRKFLRANSWLFNPSSITVTVCDPISPQAANWDEVVRLRQEVRSIIEKYCGEPTIDMPVIERT